MSDANAPPNPEELQRSGQQVFQMLTGFAATQIMLTGDELGVYETLAERSLSALELSAALQLPVDRLERLLNALSAFGLLIKQSDKYELSSIARNHLLKNSPAWMGGIFQHIRTEVYPLWGHLGHAVQHGGPLWHLIPGMNPAGPFESIYKDEAGVRQFMDAMFMLTYPAALEYAQRYDFSPYRRIIDIGGASGAFFAGVLPSFPEVQGTIFDLPAVGSVAKETMRRFGLHERVDFAGGNFFTDPLPLGADMFVLGFILHDWDESQGTLLLKKIYECLAPGGAVFICESLFNEAKDGPVPTAFMDLNMLVLTTGRERSAAEYDAWLKRVGFSRTEHQVCSGPKSFVVGYK